MYTDRRDYYENNSDDNYQLLRRKKTILTIIIMVVMVSLFILLIHYNNLKKEEVLSPSISFLNHEIVMNLGDSLKVEYNLKKVNDDYRLNFISSNDGIVNIDENGNMTAVSIGIVEITVIYYVDSNTIYSDTCNVEAIDNTDQDYISNVIVDDEKPIINYEIVKGDLDNWNNDDVILNIHATDNNKIKNIKYALNCVSKCSYNMINNDNDIVISSNGINILYVIVTDENNNSTSKLFTIKVDKTIPSVTYSLLGGEYKVNNTLVIRTDDTGGSTYDHLEIKVYYDNKQIINTSTLYNVYEVNFNKKGLYRVLTRAYDKASNYSSDYLLDNDGWSYQEYEIS